MKVFVVELNYNVPRHEREEVNPAHGAYLKALADQGKLVLAGPIAGRNSGLLIYQLPDEEALDQVLASEPYVQAGFVAGTTIKTWSPGKGFLAETLRSRKHRETAQDGYESTSQGVSA